jgi:DegV family protein with EDD domain
VSTAQASVIERREMYQKAINLHGRVLYFCVGSVYTGNYQVAEEWRKEHDPEGRMTIIDTGAASGKLGLAALATAKKSTQTDDPDQVAAYARWAAENCREFIFLDKLQYLARGGRLSRTSAFFGDMLKMKPVVTPTPNGVEKVGVARSVQDQVGLAQKLLEQHLPPGQNVAVMLEHTDNRDFLAETVQPMVQRLRPEAEILFRPVSLTSGAHMGPGTWALAWLPVE